MDKWLVFKSFRAHTNVPFKVDDQFIEFPTFEAAENFVQNEFDKFKSEAAYAKAMFHKEYFYGGVIVDYSNIVRDISKTGAKYIFAYIVNNSLGGEITDKWTYEIRLYSDRSDILEVL